MYMEDMAETAKAFYEGMRIGGVMAAAAKALYSFKLDLELAGFTSEEAMQIIVAHGFGVKQR
jgi:hypothetical protein